VPSTDFLTHNYIAVETAALIQRRRGMAQARALLEHVLPVTQMHWVKEVTHRAAVTALLLSGAPRISLVDWVSFEVMRERGITTAFAFDQDFRDQGFTTVP